MVSWTDAAQHALENYCNRTRETLRGSGADTEEVIDDLRRHIEEEIRAAKLSVVTEEDVRRILARVGEPSPANNPPRSSDKPNAAHHGTGKRPGRLVLILTFIGGILLPLGTLLFELISGISAGVLFDPMPSWFHVAAVALVPAVNFWMWQAARTGKCRSSPLAGWLNGAVTGVALYYSILYVTFAPFAACAIIFFGAGLVPLCPYFALLSVSLLRRMFRRRLPDQRFIGFWPGFIIAVVALVLSQAQTALTYNGLSLAASENSLVRLQGVKTLRTFGDRELLLRACYGLLRRNDVNFDLVRSISGGNHNISADQSREIYYRVTGKPFNSVPPPSLYTRAGRWTAWEDEFTWDEALGGEAVAGRVKGLSLQGSRMDAVVEPDAAVAYCEWTLEFKNTSTQQREARAQIVLPAGGVVSRLTLWVNGEEREAAFGGRSQVREAYQKVAVVQRRDPVLVTTCGPDRVLVQCFPVPPDGGTMKVRLGITSPLVLEALDRGRFTWPKFLERNFAFSPELKHALWIESPERLTTRNSALIADQTQSNKFSLHGNLAIATFNQEDDVIQAERQPTLRRVWTPALEPDQIIRENIQESSPEHISRAVFIIDGSVNMNEWRTEIANAITNVPTGTEIAVLVANDEPLKLNPSPARAEKQLLDSLRLRLRELRFVGGRDNVPALEQAWDLAAASDSGAVIWIHDTQPVLISSVDSLRQRLERTGKPVRIFDLQTRPGPNRVAEKLDGLSQLTLVPRFFGSVHGDLENLFATWEGKARRFELRRERVANDPSADNGKQVSRHIERLWARDEAIKLANNRQSDAAAQLAARQQLVTPLTGAVVLETKQQYAENNLNPAAANTVPSVPEPETWVLLALGAGVMIWLHFKKCRAKLNGRITLR